MELILSALTLRIFAHVQRQDLDFYLPLLFSFQLCRVGCLPEKLVRVVFRCLYLPCMMCLISNPIFLVICTVHPHQSNHNYCYLDYFVLELAYSYIAGIYKQYSLDVD
jgi:hypothetical protein